MNKQKLHRLIVVGAFVSLALMSWAWSSYKNWKYAQEEAPETTSLEEILETVSYFNGGVEGDLGDGGENEGDGDKDDDGGEREDLTSGDSNGVGDESGISESGENGGMNETGNMDSGGDNGEDDDVVENNDEADAIGEVDLNKESGFKVPDKLNVEMTFYAQAPHSNWELPYQEACEEASLLLVANLFQKKGWSVDEFDQEILKVVEWQKKVFGDYEHTDVAQTVRMAEEYLGLKTRVHENPSFEDLQGIIARGHLIVAPFAGKELKNPYYTNGGPRYHMLVIKGYDAEKGQVVTHDVGTRRGADYVYSWERIWGSLHDWDEGDMGEGAKRFIEVWS